MTNEEYALKMQQGNTDLYNELWKNIKGLILVYAGKFIITHNEKCVENLTKPYLKEYIENRMTEKMTLLRNRILQNTTIQEYIPKRLDEKTVFFFACIEYSLKLILTNVCSA